MGIIEGAKVKSKLIFIEHTKYAHQAIACTNGTANFYCDSKIFLVKQEMELSKQEMELSGPSSGVATDQ